MIISNTDVDPDANRHKWCFLSNSLKDQSIIHAQNRFLPIRYDQLKYDTQPADMNESGVL